MHAKKFMMLLILLAFVITCFITSPVFSGNGSSDGYPWDADDTGTHDDPVDGIPDTTTTHVVLTNNFVDNPVDPDLIDGVSSQILFFIVSSFYFYQPDTYIIMTEAEGSNNEQSAAVNISAK